MNTVLIMCNGHKTLVKCSGNWEFIEGTAGT